MGLKDGLVSLEEFSTTFSGTTIQGTSGTYANLSATTITGISGTNVSLTFPTAYTGSPSLGNNTIQFGTVTPSGGITADAVVIFGTPFGVAPTAITVTPLGSVVTAVGPYVIGIAAGSFTVRGGSNVLHAWIAIGSGRL